MHDSFNLAWKLNLTLRNLAQPVLIETYEDERRKVAQDLITFDYEHARAFSANDQKALADNFDANIRFISGVGAEYYQNVLNTTGYAQTAKPTEGLRSGVLLSQAKVERFFDANPVDLQLNIPMLSQFRIFFFTPNVHKALCFLSAVCQAVTSTETILGRASAAAEISYREMPKTKTKMDEYSQPKRYSPVSDIFTYALVTTMAKNDVEISDLPPVLRDSKWTFYIDNIMKPVSCTEKWVGKLDEDEVAILNVRPDGYVGSIGRFHTIQENEAVKWLDSYYGGFLKG